jgi:hypothetical protein
VGRLTMKVIRIGEAHIAALRLTVHSPLARFRAAHDENRASPIEGICRATAPAQASHQGAQRNHTALQWMAPDEFDPMSPRHPKERGIERDESRDVGMTASAKLHHGDSR